MIRLDQVGICLEHQLHHRCHHHYQLHRTDHLHHCLPEHRWPLTDLFRWQAQVHHFVHHCHRQYLCYLQCHPHQYRDFLMGHLGKHHHNHNRSLRHYPPHHQQE